MKRIFTLGLILTMLLLASSSWAAWVLKPSLVSIAKHYMTWKVECTSDGNALTATDLVTLMEPSLRDLVQGSTLMIMTVSPGTGSVAPDTTINVSLSNSQNIVVFTHDAYSNTADTTGIDLSEDYNQYLTVYSKFYLTLNDIGTSGDKVTLYFDCWVE